MFNKETTDEFLSDQEQVKIKLFVRDDVMKEAVKKILLSVVYSNGILEKTKPAYPRKNALLSLVASKETLPDEQIGKDLKIIWEAINLLESAYQQMETYNKKEFEKKDTKNIAR